jgi:hypothetical protein
MKLSEARKFPNGLYELKWKKKHGGGSSFASVGRTADGTPWFAPTNWITVPSTDWDMITGLWPLVTRENLRTRPDADI